PSSPVLLGSVATVAGTVAIEGNYAYVTTGLGLKVIDVGMPAAPAIVGTVATPGIATDVKVAGNRAYVADQSGGLQVLDVSDPRAPVVLGALGTQDAVSVSIHDTHVYVADTSGYLYIVDVSTASAPVLVATVEAKFQPWKVVFGTYQIYLAGKPNTLFGAGIQ